MKSTTTAEQQKKTGSREWLRVGYRASPDVYAGFSLLRCIFLSRGFLPVCGEGSRSSRSEEEWSGDTKTRSMGAGERDCAPGMSASVGGPRVVPEVVPWVDLGPAVPLWVSGSLTSGRKERDLDLASLSPTWVRFRLFSARLGASCAW